MTAGTPLCLCSYRHAVQAANTVCSSCSAKVQFAFLVSGIVLIHIFRPVSFFDFCQLKPFFIPHNATCPANLILLSLITIMIFGQQFRSESSSLRSLLHYPVSLSLSRPNIFLSTLFSNTARLCPSLSAKDQVSHPYKKQAKLQFCLFNLCICW